MLSEIYKKKFSASDFELFSAASGSEAIKIAQEQKPDLVLLDLILPEMDGFEILKKIRSNKELDSVKVIIFSNLSQEDEKHKAEALGANGFIAKADVTPQELVIKVKEFLK